MTKRGYYRRPVREGLPTRYRLGVEVNSQVAWRKLFIVDRVEGGWRLWLTNDEGFSSGSWIILSDTGTVTKHLNEQEIELWREQGVREQEPDG